MSKRILTDSQSQSKHGISVDVEGYLRNLDDWSEQVAEVIAESEGLQLTSEHWEIVRLLRDFYQEYKVSPAMRILVKQVKNSLGSEKGSSIYLMKLFPGSPAKLASKIAGLPKPTNCL
ncbi:TusE/DsrC/DsvC family sulfur relay protein [Motiliproteus sp. MSK22-1]|uniref:TusE/DsrC/DsvC family sulfur relay protein n=1 Tax=Motiliproteus sp. MSK22-1 TaxID=1897630 RepID=UPI000977041E|nr:TusE/DsrC/DsvC family sulfur relay protein [Motiliproteus sp. MSK22-1]OMH32683.1 sulfurtransferase TusE [Motiliproteus sp. MSK22-1]